MWDLKRKKKTQSGCGNKFEIIFILKSFYLFSDLVKSNDALQQVGVKESFIIDASEYI